MTSEKSKIFKRCLLKYSDLHILADFTAHETVSLDRELGFSVFAAHYNESLINKSLRDNEFRFKN